MGVRFVTFLFGLMLVCCAVFAGCFKDLGI